jgi:hypothetical protein
MKCAGVSGSAAGRVPRHERNEMKPPRLSSAIVPLLCAALSVGGCARTRNAPDYADTYRRLASSAVRLSIRIEPLRASRLGLAAADSLLFTYSKEEIGEAIKSLKNLETRFSKIPAGRLSAEDVDRATVIINWLRGTRFAFEGLDCARSNPLLYAWTAEEALWGMPSRIAPPHDGELEAYRQRILRIPALLASGAANLQDPADWHVRRSIEKLDTLAASFPRLALLVETRYGTRLDRELAAAGEAIRSFREYASSTLLPSSYGCLIIGSENLAKTFQYDETIDTDPNVLILEAEKQIRRLAIEKISLERRIEFEKRGAARTIPSGVRPPANEPFEERVARLLEGLGAQKGREALIGNPRGPKVALAYPASPRFVSRSSKSPNLSIPFEGDATVATISSPISTPPCTIFLALAPGAERDGDAALRFALLCAAPRMLDPERIRCAARDTVSAVFSSATFEAGWRYLVLQELAPDMKKDDPGLYLLVLGDWLREYARLTVVLSLHAGTMTSDAAAQYLVETLALEPGEATREVLAASVSPALAYPAISMILVDQMLKNVSYAFGYGKPQQELAKILLASREIPLSMIVPKTIKDMD